MIPGEIAGPDTDIVINEGRTVLRIRVENGGDRPIQVGSHYHFAEANPSLRFDRQLARGHRLDVPAGTAIRFEPGIATDVDLVPLVGNRIVAGLRGETAGPLDSVVDQPAADAPGTNGSSNPGAPS